MIRNGTSFVVVLENYRAIQCAMQEFNRLFRFLLPPFLSIFFVLDTIVVYISMAMYSILPFIIYVMFFFVAIIINFGIVILFYEAALLHSLSTELITNASVACVSRENQLMSKKYQKSMNSVKMKFSIFFYAQRLTIFTFYSAVIDNVVLLLTTDF